MRSKSNEDELLEECDAATMLPGDAELPPVRIVEGDGSNVIEMAAAYALDSTDIEGFPSPQSSYKLQQVFQGGEGEQLVPAEQVMHTEDPEKGAEVAIRGHELLSQQVVSISSEPVVSILQLNMQSCDTAGQLSQTVNQGESIDMSIKTAEASRDKNSLASPHNTAQSLNEQEEEDNIVERIIEEHANHIVEKDKLETSVIERGKQDGSANVVSMESGTVQKLSSDLSNVTIIPISEGMSVREVEDEDVVLRQEDVEIIDVNLSDVRELEKTEMQVTNETTSNPLGDSICKDVESNTEIDKRVDGDERLSNEVVRDNLLYSLLKGNDPELEPYSSEGLSMGLEENATRKGVGSQVASDDVEMKECEVLFSSQAVEPERIHFSSDDIQVVHQTVSSSQLPASSVVVTPVTPVTPSQVQPTVEPTASKASTSVVQNAAVCQMPPYTITTAISSSSDTVSGTVVSQSASTLYASKLHENSTKIPQQCDSPNEEIINSVSLTPTVITDTDSEGGGGAGDNNLLSMSDLPIGSFLVDPSGKMLFAVNSEGGNSQASQEKTAAQINLDADSLISLSANNPPNVSISAENFISIKKPAAIEETVPEQFLNVNEATSMLLLSAGDGGNTVIDSGSFINPTSLNENQKLQTDTAISSSSALTRTSINITQASLQYPAMLTSNAFLCTSSPVKPSSTLQLPITSLTKPSPIHIPLQALIPGAQTFLLQNSPKPPPLQSGKQTSASSFHGSTSAGTRMKRRSNPPFRFATSQTFSPSSSSTTFRPKSHVTPTRYNSALQASSTREPRMPKQTLSGFRSERKPPYNKPSSLKTVGMKSSSVSLPSLPIMKDAETNRYYVLMGNVGANPNAATSYTNFTDAPKVQQSIPNAAVVVSSSSATVATSSEASNPMTMETYTFDKSQTDNNVMSSLNNPLTAIFSGSAAMSTVKSSPYLTSSLAASISSSATSCISSSGMSFTSSPSLPQLSDSLSSRASFNIASSSDTFTPHEKPPTDDSEEFMDIPMPSSSPPSSPPPPPDPPTLPTPAAAGMGSEDYVYLSGLEPEDYMEEVLIEDNSDMMDNNKSSTSGSSYHHYRTHGGSGMLGKSSLRSGGGSQGASRRQNPAQATILTQLLTQPQAGSGGGGGGSRGVVVGEGQDEATRRYLQMLQDVTKRDRRTVKEESSSDDDEEDSDEDSDV